MTNNRIYTGFSTLTEGVDRKWVLYDIDLINRDLLNHFHTQIGERVMRPEYGCSIWNYIGEQLTPDVRDEIREEAERILGLDSRIENRGIKVYSSAHTITVSVTIYYSEIDRTEEFKVSFDKRQRG